MENTKDQKPAEEIKGEEAVKEAAPQEPQAKAEPAKEEKAAPAPEAKPEAAESPAEAPKTESADAPETDKKKKKKEKKTIGFMENLIEWVKDIALAVLAAILILQFVQPTIVRQISMEDTLVENDYVFVSKQSYTIFGEPERGDIIVFKSTLFDAAGNEKLLVKRIIGLPGDAVSIKQGVVYVNGEALDETYLKDGYTATEMEEVKVAANCYFVMGDNRQHSTDSRSESVGQIRKDDIVGKVVLRAYPFDKFGPVK